jgi:hypothetical protein
VRNEEKFGNGGPLRKASTFISSNIKSTFVRLIRTMGFLLTTVGDSLTVAGGGRSVSRSSSAGSGASNSISTRGEIDERSRPFTVSSLLRVMKMSLKRRHSMKEGDHALEALGLNPATEVSAPIRSLGSMILLHSIGTWMGLVIFSPQRGA